jgi:type I restriction enzyme M protein
MSLSHHLSGEGSKTSILTFNRKSLRFKLMSNQNPIVQELSNFIWSVADLLRGPYRPPQYERVMLPMTVLRRFDCVLEATKPAVLERFNELERSGKYERLSDNIDKELNTIAGGGVDIGFHNRSDFNFARLRGDPNNIDQHLARYIDGFSKNVRDIFKHFDFEKEIERLVESDRLFLIVQQFGKIDLHPDRVTNIDMGLLFEDLIRRFNEAANETAGDHFTPREVIRLMVNLLLEPDASIFTAANKITTIYDPTCGTGGMLSEGENWIIQHSKDRQANVFAYGQDYNPRSYAVAVSDRLMKGQQSSAIKLGNTLTNDQFDGIKNPNLPAKFDYLLANPPFGVDWKGQLEIIEDEHKKAGYAGRFGPKLPRVNDGALLFLLHMISKFEPAQKPAHENAPLFNQHTEASGSRAAVVFNGSPLFTGGAGSGESEIRRWIIENDWLEAIVALPEQMFYNTGIGTFVWIVTNRKVKERKGKIQLIDARDRWTPMRRSLGDKRRYLSDETIIEITREHGGFKASKHSKLFDNTYFGYRRITVERPLRLRFQITQSAKETFLYSAPEYLDLILALEQDYGREPHMDWNIIRHYAETGGKLLERKWPARIAKFFRDVFTTVDPTAEPVIAKRGDFAGTVGAYLFPDHAMPKGTQAELDAIFGIYPEAKGKKTVKYESDPKLRDSENVPLSEDVVAFFLREVRPFVLDAWIDPDAADEKDGGAGKKGYEINFNREFFRYEPPRALGVIDRELSEVEARILKLLQAVTT